VPHQPVSVNLVDEVSHLDLRRGTYHCVLEDDSPVGYLASSQQDQRVFCVYNRNMDLVASLANMGTALRVTWVGDSAEDTGDYVESSTLQDLLRQTYDLETFPRVDPPLQLEPVPLAPHDEELSEEAILEAPTVQLRGGRPRHPLSGPPASFGPGPGDIRQDATMRYAPGEEDEDEEDELAILNEQTVVLPRGARPQVPPGAPAGDEDEDALLGERTVIVSTVQATAPDGAHRVIFRGEVLGVVTPTDVPGCWVLRDAAGKRLALVANTGESYMLTWMGRNAEESTDYQELGSFYEGLQQTYGVDQPRLDPPWSE
jgi:hypothetical protein